MMNLTENGKLYCYDSYLADVIDFNSNLASSRGLDWIELIIGKIKAMIK